MSSFKIRMIYYSEKKPPFHIEQEPRWNSELLYKFWRRETSYSRREKNYNTSDSSLHLLSELSWLTSHYTHTHTHTYVPM